MMPAEPGPPGVETSTPAVPAPSPYRWYHKLGSFLLIVISLTIGIFLLTFPWTPFWDSNIFAVTWPQWRDSLTGSYARGAVSGLGAINLYISLIEVFRLRRFARY